MLCGCMNHSSSFPHFLSAEDFASCWLRLALHQRLCLGPVLGTYSHIQLKSRFSNTRDVCRVPDPCRGCLRLKIRVSVPEHQLREVLFRAGQAALLPSPCLPRNELTCW